MSEPRLYDPDLAPADHAAEVIARCRTSPPSNSPLVSPIEYRDGAFRCHPHGHVPLTSVHSPEIKSRDYPEGPTWGAERVNAPPSVTFRHSGWARSRRLVRRALAALDTPPRALARFDACGSDPWVMVDANDSSRLSVQSNHCHSRWCTPCSRERAARIVGNLRPQLEDGPILFLTLTMKHSDSPLSGQIDRIYDSFRKMRRAPFWTAAVDAGCAVLEMKHSHTTGCWHVHLHCLLHSCWVEHRDLKAEWWRITGDSNIVDIRTCGTADDAAHYITKYITKPVPSSVINKDAQLIEMMAAVAHRRLVLTWGSWRGVPLSAPLDMTDWQPVASLDSLYARKANGDADAYDLLRQLERLFPEASIIAGRSPPTPHDDPIGILF